MKSFITDQIDKKMSITNHHEFVSQQRKIQAGNSFGWSKGLGDDDVAIMVPKPAVPKIRKSIIQRHCNNGYNLVTSTPIKQNAATRQSVNAKTPFAKYRQEDKDETLPRSPSGGVVKRRSANRSNSRQQSFGRSKDILSCVIDSFKKKDEGSLGTSKKILSGTANGHSSKSERNVESIPGGSKIDNVVQNESGSNGESNRYRELISEIMDRKSKQIIQKCVRRKNDKSNPQNKSKKLEVKCSKLHRPRYNRKRDNKRLPPVSCSSSGEDLDDESESSVEQNYKRKNIKKTHGVSKWRESKCNSKISKYVDLSSSNDSDYIYIKKVEKPHQRGNRRKTPKYKSKKSNHYSISLSDSDDNDDDAIMEQHYKSKLNQSKCNSKEKPKLNNIISSLHEKLNRRTANKIEKYQQTENTNTNKSRSEDISSSSDDNLEEVNINNQENFENRRNTHINNNVNREIHKNLSKVADRSKYGCNTCKSRRKMSCDDVIQNAKTSTTGTKERKVKEYEGPKQKRQFSVHKSIQTHVISLPRENTICKSASQMKTADNVKKTTKLQCLFDESHSDTDVVEAVNKVDTSESIDKMVLCKVQDLLEEWPSSDTSINQMDKEDSLNLPTSRNDGLQKNLEECSTQREHIVVEEGRHDDSIHTDNEKAVVPISKSSSSNVKITPQNCNKKSTTESENVYIHNVIVLIQPNNQEPTSATNQSDKDLEEEIIDNDKHRNLRSRYKNMGMIQSRDFDKGLTKMENHRANGSRRLFQNREDNYKGQNEIETIISQNCIEDNVINEDKSDVIHKFESVEKTKFSGSYNNSLPKQSVIEVLNNEEDIDHFASAQPESFKKHVDTGENYSVILEMDDICTDIRNPNEVHSSSPKHQNKESSSVRSKTNIIDNTLAGELSKRGAYVSLEQCSAIERILRSKENTAKSKDFVFAKPLPKQSDIRKGRSRKMLQPVVNQEESLSTTETVRRSGRQRKPVTFSQLVIEGNAKYLRKLAKASDNCALTTDLKSYKDMENSSKQLRSRNRNITGSTKENLEGTVSKRKPRAKGKASPKKTTPATEKKTRGGLRRQALTDTNPIDEAATLSTVQEEEASTSKKTSARGKKKPTAAESKGDADVVAPDFEPPPMMEELYVQLTPTLSVQIDDNRVVQELNNTDFTTKRKVSDISRSSCEEQSIDDGVESVECFKRTQQYIETRDECVKKAMGLKHSCSQAYRLRISGNGKKSKQMLHKCFMHFTVLKGCCKVVIQEASEILGVGHDAVVPMGATYSIQNDDPNETLEIYCVRFKCEET